MLRSIRSSEWTLLLPISFMVALSPWASGRASFLQPALLWVSLICFFVFLFASSQGGRNRDGDSFFTRVRALLGDPVFYLGGAFILFLTLQWLNSGRVQVFDVVLQQWGWSSPPLVYLPSSIEQQEAFEMLIWFVPAVVLIVTMRHGLKSVTSYLVVYAILILNAFFLAFNGLLVLSKKSDASLHWVPPDFFSSFGYQNHAGSYFVLMMGVAGGGMAYLLSVSKLKNRALVGLLGMACILLFLAAAFLSLSRAAMVFSVCLAVVILCLVGYRYFRQSSYLGRAQFGLGCLAFILITFFLVGGSNPKWVKTELNKLQPSNVVGDLLSEGRSFQLKPALDMWLEHPLYGVGGWGYGHMLSTYLEKEKWPLIQEGAANAHCDPVQFLTEFGLLGFGLLVSILICSTKALRQGYWVRDPLFLIPLCGAGFVLAGSLIDLPFRNPGIIYHWLFIVVGSNNMFAQTSKHRTRK